MNSDSRVDQTEVITSDIKQAPAEALTTPHPFAAILERKQAAANAAAAPAPAPNIGMDANGLPVRRDVQMYDVRQLQLDWMKTRPIRLSTGEAFDILALVPLEVARAILAEYKSETYDAFISAVVNLAQKGDQQ